MAVKKNDTWLENGALAAEKTRHIKSWKLIAPGSDEALTRDYFLHCLSSLSPHEMQSWKDHSFWQSWRSFKNGSDVLDHALREARDPLWVSTLVDWGLKVDDNRHPRFENVLHRGREFHEPFLKALHDVGYSFTKDHRLMSFLSLAVMFGYWGNLLFLDQIGAFPKFRRECSVNIEKEIISRRSFFRPPPGQTDEISLDQMSMVRLVYDFLWQRWGVPCADDFRTLQLRALKSADIPSVEIFIWDFFNPAHPEWTEEDDERLCLLLQSSGRTQQLAERVAKGYDVPPKVLEKMRQRAHDMARFDPASLEKMQEVEALITKARLDRDLASIEEKSFASRQKKM